MQPQAGDDAKFSWLLICLCTGNSCQPPTKDIEKLKQMME
jgi:uncharacterized protein YyaL (SSP411 family)